MIHVAARERAYRWTECGEVSHPCARRDVADDQAFRWKVRDVDVHLCADRVVVQPVLRASLYSRSWDIA